MHRAALLLALLALAPRLAPAQRTGHLRGLVVTPEGRGLANSIVAIDAPTRELLADDSGGFFFAELAPGPHHIRARHLGFAPLDTTVVVDTAATPAPVVLRLTRLTMRLAEIEVRAQKECRAPGPPDPGVEPALALIFEQLRENADRWVLFAAGHPFVWRMERHFDSRGNAGSLPDMRPDTVVIGSLAKWGYAPGRVVTEVNQNGRRERQLNIPGLRDLADTAFHRSHCFTYGGLETIADTEYVRVDFRVASSLHDPDIDGSAYLDPESYLLRRAVVRLTHPGKVNRAMKELEVTSWFHEIAPAVVILADLTAVTHFDVGRGREIERRETQHTVGVTFAGAAPPGLTLP